MTAKRSSNPRKTSPRNLPPRDVPGTQVNPGIHRSMNMKAVKSVLILSIGASMAVYCVYADKASADNGRGSRGPVGSYFSAFDYGGAQLLATAQIHSDGTFMFSDQTDLGGVDGIKNTPVYGV